MRSLLFGVLAGCGRFGFDPGIDPGGDGSITGDARLDALACTMAGNDDDGDGLVDTCDPCPYLAGNAGDADGDGVGDACDPTGNNDRFVIFDPFVGATLDARWTAAGDVTLGSSTVRFDGGAPSLGYATVPATTEAAMRGTIAEIRAGIHMLSVQFGEITNPDAEYCEVYGNPGMLLKITRATGVNYDSIAETPIPALAPGPFALRFRHSAAGFWCELATNGQTYTASGTGTFAEPRSFTYMQFSSMLVTVDAFAEIAPAP